MEVARRRRAAAGSGLRSSGAVGEGSGRAVAGVVVVVVGDVGGPFIGRAEQGGGGSGCRCLPPSLLRDTLSSRVCR